VISSETSVDGAGTITVSGSHAVRVFRVQEGGTLNLRNLAIVDGKSGGVSGDPPDGGGGGIYDEGGTVNVVRGDGQDTPPVRGRRGGTPTVSVLGTIARRAFNP